jgi:hypothetical protein
MKKCALLWCAMLLSMFVVPRAEALGGVCQAVIGSGQPAGLAVDTVHQTVWVAFFQGNYVLELASNGDMWVTCYYSQKVDRISMSGTVLARISTPTSGPTGITDTGGLIWGVTDSGYMYSIDTSNNTAGNSTFRGGGPHAQYDIRFVYPNILWTTDIGSGIVSELTN